jgi:hypothetical protein
VRECIDLHDSGLKRDWELAREAKPVRKLMPLEFAEKLHAYMPRPDVPIGYE